MTDNIIFLSDSYKSSHHLQYPPNTTLIYSYFESRGGRFPYTTFFGLQYILKKYLIGPVVTKEKILEAKEFYKVHMRNENLFNEEGWNYIVEKYGGHLPVRICAVPEGSIIPTKNVLFTVENTDPKTYWLTSYLESILVQCWYPMTVATVSRIQKQILSKYLDDTSENKDSLPVMLHDFGFRGVSSVESAGIGGMGHLVNFQGSDTVASIRYAHKYYHCDMAGFSVIATEHSTITAWGREREFEAFDNMLTKFPTGPVATVIDSYNMYKASEEIIGKMLKEKIIENGKHGGIYVARPDSGDPKEVLVKLLDIFEKCFGSEKNSKGYKVLPPYIKILQGDGINYRMIGSILECLTAKGWSADNLLFGSGGALLQKNDRDTQKCAFKCSMAVIEGEEVEVYKDPITDPGKKSKRGRLTLEKRNGKIVTVQHGQGDKDKDLLIPVFENGVLLKDYTFEEIRKSAELTPEDIDVLEFLKEDQDA